MPTISVRIDPELKKQMDSLKYLNWSEIIRKAIQEQIKMERESNLAKAVLINEKVRKKSPAGFDSTNVIRKFREERKEY